jgi:alpha-tubulin suppressor-like RCC1 family protein
VYCWGQNGVGQLGDGTTVSRNQPVRSAGTLTFASLDAGAYHTCALTGTGQAYCWGANGAVGVNGLPLGTPTTQVCANPEAPYRGDSWPCSPNPVAVSGGLTFRSISSGVLATCGVALNGEASCWGWNILYQLGNGTDADATAPTLMAGGLRFDALALGGVHGCGLVSGQAYCWGAKVFSWGQLGTGSLQGSSTPAAVVGGLTFTTVIPSSANNILSFTCGLTPPGAAYCWGTSRHGQLGTTSMLTPSCAVVNGADIPCTSVPVPVAGGIAFATLALGEEFACGLDRDGAAFCWGRNDFSQLGDGTTTDRNIPTPVVPLP